MLGKPFSKRQSLVFAFSKILIIYTVSCLHVCLHVRIGHHSCEPRCGCRELNSEPLEEQLGLFTSELPLQPLVLAFPHIGTPKRLCVQVSVCPCPSIHVCVDLSAGADRGQKHWISWSLHNRHLRVGNQTRTFRNSSLCS